MREFGFVSYPQSTVDVRAADLSSFHGHNSLRTTHWDSLEKALTVFILPPSSPFYHGTRRRLDLIFALPEVYWPAVIGWYEILSQTLVSK
jgi:hypothetical protein